MNRYFGLAFFAVATAGALAWACSDDTTTPAGGSTSGTDGTGSTSGTTTGSSTSGTPDTTVAVKAKAVIAPTSDASTVNGTAEFVENGSVMTVQIDVSSGGAAGDHGLHIHQNGNCDPADAGADKPPTAAGGAGSHWNPEDAGHNLPSAPTHHLGDMGNITIDAQGKGSMKLTFGVNQGPYVHDGPMSVVGHAVVFHQYKDDGISQPTGDAGARPGCGVIVKE